MALLDIQNLAYEWIEGEIQRLIGLQLSLAGSQATSEKIKVDNIKTFCDRVQFELTSQGMSVADQEIVSAVQSLVRGIISVTPGSLGDPAVEEIYEQLLEQIGCTFLLDVNAPVYITFLALQKIKSYAHLEKVVLQLLFDLSIYLMLCQPRTEVEKVSSSAHLSWVARKEFAEDYAYSIEKLFESAQRLGTSLSQGKSNQTAFDDYLDHSEKIFLDYMYKTTNDLDFLARSIQETYMVLELIHEELVERLVSFSKIISNYEALDLSAKIAKDILKNISLSVDELRKYVTGIRTTTAKTIRENFIQLAAGQEVTKAIFRANDPSGTTILSGDGSRSNNYLDCGKKVKEIKIGDYVAVSAVEVDSQTGRTINYRTVTAIGTNTIQVSSKFLESGGTKYMVYRDGSLHYGKYNMTSQALNAIGLQPTLRLERFGDETFHRLCGLFTQACVYDIAGRTWNGPDVTDPYFDLMQTLRDKIQDIIDISNSFFMEKLPSVHNILKLSTELGFDNIKTEFLKGNISGALSMDAIQANSSVSLINSLSSLLGGE